MGNSLRNTSAVKVLRILEEIVKNENGLGVTELANNLDLNKSTTYRFLATLEEEGYLEQNSSTENYVIGTKLFEFSSKVVNQTNWTKAIHPYLLSLKSKIQETVHLGIEDNGEVVYIDKVESDRSIRMYSKIGRRSPIFCTGVGKAILAFLPPATQKEIIDNIPFKRFTPNTVANKEELMKELKKIKAQGYSLDREEHEEGVNCAAAPVFNFEGKLLGAISVAGPKSRINDENLLDLAATVKETATLISKRLGSL
ncbi:IclR family transcriptional regulator [Planococcus lenghuensis]|uniref:Glycerol operon regulatory protein n=1 Tax=Planococcus lenghuensis TaxID=2213202 RepID=A0A1Q2L693_9BACL|nr:IclR family transcriptional regulator [Planococcus lenghuensis]AQQ55607.1 hypothetical protein B0X71_20760 [Planococcus lenghuensis]